MSDLHNEGSGSGLSVAEAKAFHQLFVISFIAFIILAIVAHLLVWQWRPWGWSYTTSMLDTASVFLSHLA